MSAATRPMFPFGVVPTFYECGICGGFHSVLWDGDCREDTARFTPDELDEWFPNDLKDEIAMEDIEAWREVHPHGKRLEGWAYHNAAQADIRQDESPEATAKRSPAEIAARAAGWFPTRQAHIMFQESAGVCRHLTHGETYTEATDSLMSSPLRHATSWADACRIDKLALTL